MLSLQLALIDADSRVFVSRQGDRAAWDMPVALIRPGADALDQLVQVLQDRWGVTTFAKAFFPLTFAWDETHHHTTLLYGCRNWVGANGLQQVQATDVETQWVKPVRLGDHTLAPSVTAMLPVVMQLLGAP